MSKLRALFDNLTLGSGVSVAASSTATGYAATNLLNAKRGLPWRSSTTTSNQTVTITFGAAKTLKAIFLINPKAQAGGTILVETKNGGGAYSAFGGGTGLVALSTTARTRLTGIWHPAGTVATDIRITFSTSGASDYAELGVVFAADASGYFDATVNVTDDYRYQPIDLSEVAVSIGGQEQIWRKSHLLTLSTTFAYIGSTQTTALWALHDTVGTSTSLILAVDPDNLDEIAYGRLTTFEPRHLVRDQWAVDMAFREAA